MSDAKRLHELHDLARRLALGTTDRDTREALTLIADDYLSQAEALEAPKADPEDEPPLTAM